jgi:hypothetical protein
MFSRGFVEEFVQDHLQKRHRVTAGKGKQATKTRAKNTDNGSVEHKTDGLPEKETFGRVLGVGSRYLQLHHCRVAPRTNSVEQYFTLDVPKVPLCSPIFHLLPQKITPASPNCPLTPFESLY